MYERFDQKMLLKNLRDIDQAEMSGALAINTGSKAFYIYFQSGQVVFALESLPGEQRTVELNRRRALQLGQFAQGSLTFNGAVEPPQQHDWHLRAAELILEAARRVEDENQLHSKIGNFNQMIQPVFDFERRVQDLLLTPAEAALLDEVKVPIAIKELVTKLSRPRLETLRSIYALLSAGILETLPSASNSAERLETGFAPATAHSEFVLLDPSEPAPPAQTTAYRANPAVQARPAVQAIQASPVPEQVAPTSPDPNGSTQSSKRDSKIDTGKLAALAGVKIRSSLGSPEQANAASSESERCFQQARAMLNLGNITGAEVLLRKAVSLAPDHVPYLLRLGRLLSKMPKKQKEAEGLLLRACGNDATALEPRLALAELYESFGMKAKVEVLLKSVLNIDPKHELAQRKLKEMNGGPSIWRSDLGTLLNRLKR